MNEAKPKGPSGQQRVLIVDDNQEAAEMLQMLLEMHGYTVEVANSGAQGLAIHARFAPHVVCSDLNMPGMSGYEFARAIRASGLPRPWLIAMSGEELAGAQDIVAAGFDHSLVKPFSFDDMLAGIQRMRARSA